MKDTPPRCLGLDYGDKTIGVAVSNGPVATGVETIRRTGPDAFKPAIARLRELIARYNITHIILGNPLHMDGTPSARSAQTAHFAQRLRRNFKRLTVEMWDERLSTQAVTRTLRDAARVDEMAAAYILQGYLDKINRTPKEPTMDEQLFLTDENGNEQPFDILATKEHENTLYLLAAEANNEEEAEIVHFKCVATEGEDMVFEFVDEEDSEFEKMAELFAAEYEELGVIME